jgi:hypothetical protein
MNASEKQTAPLTDGVAKLLGADGNAFGILGRVRRAILASNHPELTDAFMREATAKDYDHLLATCQQYVTIE